MGGKSDGGSDCSAVSYDLSTPPSRADVGMASGASYTNKACDDGFELTLVLPEGAGTTLTARRVNADSYSTADPASSVPTTMDVHSVSLSLEDAVAEGRRLADELGIDHGPLAAWRTRVEASESTDAVDTPFMRARLGYLGVEMQVQHLGVSGDNYLHLIFSWR